MQALSAGQPTKRIGLLGGSFNPAHAGHVHISRQARRHLDLDQVWWLVSPQNPLKPERGMAPFRERIGAARATAEDSGVPILVTAIEDEMGTRYSVDTLAALKGRFPGHRFVWIMGADNLIQAHRWKDWRTFFRTVPIAVFSRPPYSSRALKAKAAWYFAAARWRQTRAARLAGIRPPAWIFLRRGRHPASATGIRALGENER